MKNLFLYFLVLFFLSCAGVFRKKERVSFEKISDSILVPLQRLETKPDCDVVFTKEANNLHIGQTFGEKKEDGPLENSQIFALINCTKIKRFLTVLLISEKNGWVRFLFPDYSIPEEASLLTGIRANFPSGIYESKHYKWVVDYPTGKNIMVFIFSKEKPEFLKKTVKADSKQILSDKSSIDELRDDFVIKIEKDIAKDAESHFIKIYNYTVNEKKIEEKKETTDGV